jgi:FAD/FMN-containing dehydrogenase
VDVPLARAAEFLDFFQREIGILPVWVCPARGDRPDRPFPLFRMDRAPLYVNFGFWDVIEGREQFEPAHYNRRIEQEVIRLGGIKSLYSAGYFPRAEFDQAYGMAEYERLKAKYDPERRAPHLYDKCVRRA